MKLTDIQYNMAAAYVKGELDGKTLADFEATLKDNEALREEVIFQKSIGSALRLDMVEEATKQAKIDNLLEDKTEHPQFEVIRNNVRQARVDNVRQQKRIRRWLAGLAAACLIGVGSCGDDVITGIQTNTMIKSWYANLNPFSDDEYELVNETDQSMEELLQVAEEEYAKGELEAALASLNKISEEKLPAQTLLGKGKIHAQLKNYEESKRLLLLATASDEIKIKDDAHLRLGMVHLRLREKDEAKKQLAQISTEAKKTEAKQMMKTYLWFYPDFETQK